MDYARKVATTPLLKSREKRKNDASIYRESKPFLLSLRCVL